VADEVLMSSLIIQHDGIRAAGNTAQQQLESHGMTGHCNSYPNPVSASQRRANQQQNQQRRRQHPDQQHFASAGSQGQQNSAADAALMTHGAYFAVDLIGDDVKGAILDDCLLMTPDMEIKLEEDCNTHGGDSNDGWWLQPQSTDHRRQLCDIHRVDNRSSISALPGSAQQLPICSQIYKHKSVSLADLTEGASIDSSVNAEANWNAPPRSDLIYSSPVRKRQCLLSGDQESSAEATLAAAGHQPPDGGVSRPAEETCVTPERASMAKRILECASVKADAVKQKAERRRKISAAIDGATRTATALAIKQPASNFRGITRHRTTGRYEAHLWDSAAERACSSSPSGRKRGKQIYLGGYADEIEAAKAYDKAALTFWDDRTRLNFPDHDYSQDIAPLKGLSQEAVVALLRRGSSGFSRGASRFRGVTKHHMQDKWEARIGRSDGRRYMYLGTFPSQEDAARAYDRAAIKSKGPNAVTNFDISDYDAVST